MQNMMEGLYRRFERLVEARWFKLVMDAIIYANPVAILPQVLVALTASDLSGVAVFMWYIFAAIQLAFVFHGIKAKSASVFLSMLISFLESIIIIAAVYVRG